MTEVFRKYPETTPAEERKGSPVCVVSHPDAGGPCRREAIGEVWALPFCEVHGREAELAAKAEIEETTNQEIQMLADAERGRFDTNWPFLEVLKAARVPYEVDPLIHEAAILKAYPPEELEANTDPDTLRYDYGRRGMDNPHDWWCEAQLMVCRFMRQAHDHGLAGLLRDLEYVRERATVQRVLADRYMDRQFGPART